MTPFKERVIDEDATVYERLMKAGAILVAKPSTGAIAVTAQWFGGLTRNPWNTGQDASGSSAGPGAATASGLVGFSIGSDRARVLIHRYSISFTWLASSKSVRGGQPPVWASA